ncbi:efflux RND transporter periplasmic adaptor subunit, partial [Prosthecomicrobium hirschii]|uniref:efflux RND transporter periplasmic adaptor subunit n=1 Tax=Prosthecodimorpha hirschii TaxID=665126 RepID=UPI00112E4484
TAGIVLARSARIGAVAGGSGEPLFRIARDGKIELEADVPEGQISKLRLGQPVDVTPAGFNAPIRGEIRLLSPQIDTTTRLGRVRVALPADAAVRSGSFARGTIETARRSGVSVPRSAVMTERGHVTVQAVKDGRIETRKVEVGLSGDGRVLILSGIEAGEQVVVKAGTFVRHGDQVTPVVAKAEEIGG